MTLSFDRKEDLRLRMADLEEKLAESEEERCKLEKTCNVLMRAFREEEKIRYKTLNKNYEKFLQDCTVRKRRNDIIMRSLCRIEDRSRALYAKTERLKLLKDRYISYLKITEIKGGVSLHLWRTFPPSSLSTKTNSEANQKFVQWKNPLVIDHKIIDVKNVEEKSIWSSKTSSIVSRNSIASPEKWNTESKQNSKYSRTSVFEGISRTETPDRSYDAQNLLGTKLHSPLDNPLTASVDSEELTRTINREKPVDFGHLKNNISNELEVKDLVEVTVSKEKNDLSHQESIKKLKKALSFEEEFFINENNDEKNDLYDKKGDVEKSDKSDKNPDKEQNSDVSLHKINNYLMTSSSSVFEKDNHDNHGDNVEREIITESTESNLPMGLDGIDYQNETYPESYYEQPVHHHNHTSIVSDVILEEDETEQDVDEEEKEIFVEDHLLPKYSSLGQSMWKESPGHKTDEPSDKPQKNWKNETNYRTVLSDKVDDLNEKTMSEVKSQEPNSEKLSERKSSDVECSEESEKLAEENTERKKNVRSNLIHLLESDSESFQIEHGDVASGNEESDFDFSFN